MTGLTSVDKMSFDSWIPFWTWLELHLIDFDISYMRENEYFRTRTKEDWKERICLWVLTQAASPYVDLTLPSQNTLKGWDIVFTLAFKKCESQRLFDEEEMKFVRSNF